METIASIKEVQDFRGVRVYQVLNLNNKVIAERSFYEDAVAYVDSLLSAKSKIKMTVWGNWNGYVGTRKVMEFGCGSRGESLAREWLDQQKCAS